MYFSIENLGDIVVARVNLSRATFREAEEFKSKISEQLENGFTKIIVDLSDCNFIDSTFLSTMVSVLKNVSKKGGSLKLIGVHAEAQALLELTGTAKIFEIYESKEQAIKSFKTKAA